VYRLAPGGHVAVPVTVTPPADAPPGLYFLSARTVHRADTIEDVLTIAHGGVDNLAEFLPVPGPVPEDGVAAGGTHADAARATGLEVVLMTPTIQLPAGGSDVLVVRLGNVTRDEIRGVAQLVSPWGTWEWLPSVLREFVVGPGESTDVSFPVTVPAGANPSHAWALPKLMWFGRAQYAAAARLVVERE
jgi:hypothetical protein